MRALRTCDGGRAGAHAALAALVGAAGASSASGQCEVDKLLASDGSAGDFFGTDVDIAGDLAIVGGYFSNAAYIYRFDGADWVQEAILVADNPAPLDLFGKAVAIGGNVAVVGAYNDEGDFTGSAHVFRFDPDSSTWLTGAKLVASDAAPGSAFGYSVAISGDTIVVGAFSDDNENGQHAGAAYVFRWDGSAWVEETKLLPTSNPTGSNAFGWSVAVDGDLAVVGAPGSGESGTAPGTAYVYHFDGSGWVQEAELVDRDIGPEDFFGGSVAISGNVAVVGSVYNGSASVLRHEGFAWVREAHLLPSDGALHFGNSLSIDGDIIVVGAVGANVNGPTSGAAYLFRLDNSCSTWLERAMFLAADGASDDNLGDSVAISGDVAVLGASSDDDNGDGAGSAYVFAGLTGLDCNANGVADACDLHAGTSRDANGNRVPDECDCPWDLDGDAGVGIADFLGVLAAWGSEPGGPPDFDGDGGVGILDFLALLGNWGPCPLYVDCNGNGVFDLVDIQGGRSTDCNGNLAPDECDLVDGSSADCNVNGAPDECDLCGGASPDCNSNVVPDECDIANWTSPDLNDNGVPDECDFSADDCDDAIAITDGATPFLTFGATTDLPPVSCEGGPAIPVVNDVWFVYTASCFGTVTFSLCNDSDFDTILVIYYAGTCPAPTSVTPLACSDDAPGCGQTSLVEVLAVPGLSFLVRVGSHEGGGNGVLSVSCQPFL